MDIAELIKHREMLDRNTLYELRALLALYPYYQTARLLLLHNLFLLHDPTFDEELSRAAIYITDRNVLFQMTEAAHYRLPSTIQPQKSTPTADGDRTSALIDSFLDTIPHDTPATERKGKRKPTTADATIDYAAYLVETGGDEEEHEVPQLQGQDLIDSFINNDKGKIVLSETPQYTPDLSSGANGEGEEQEEGFFTETLARIYIKQGRYDKALEIIRRLSLDYPKKNAYFADQIRFLEKLIVNSNKNKQ